MLMTEGLYLSRAKLSSMLALAADLWQMCDGKTFSLNERER